MPTHIIHLDILDAAEAAIVQEVLRVSMEHEQARRKRQRLPQVPKNAPREAKAQRVRRAWQPAQDVAPDQTCVFCMEPRGRKTRAAWQTPCCRLYACDKCCMAYARYPHGGVCEDCTAAARERGGAHMIDGGQQGCRCVYLCPQRCDPNGMSAS